MLPRPLGERGEGGRTLLDAGPSCPILSDWAPRPPLFPSFPFFAMFLLRHVPAAAARPPAARGHMSRFATMDAAA